MHRHQTGSSGAAARLGECQALNHNDIYEAVQRHSPPPAPSFGLSATTGGFRFVSEPGPWCSDGFEVACVGSERSGSHRLLRISPRPVQNGPSGSCLTGPTTTRTLAFSSRLARSQDRSAPSAQHQSFPCYEGLFPVQGKDHSLFSAAGKPVQRIALKSKFGRIKG